MPWCEQRGEGRWVSTGCRETGAGVGKLAEEMAEGTGKAGGPNRTEVFVLLAMGDASATVAYEETRRPCDTGAWLPPCNSVDRPCGVIPFSFTHHHISHISLPHGLGTGPLFPGLWSGFDLSALSKSRLFSASQPPAQCPHLSVIKASS